MEYFYLTIMDCLTYLIAFILIVNFINGLILIFRRKIKNYKKHNMDTKQNKQINTFNSPLPNFEEPVVSLPAEKNDINNSVDDLRQVKQAVEIRIENTVIECIDTINDDSTVAVSENSDSEMHEEIFEEKTEPYPEKALTDLLNAGYSIRTLPKGKKASKDKTNIARSYGLDLRDGDTIVKKQ